MIHRIALLTLMLASSLLFGSAPKITSSEQEESNAYMTSVIDSEELDFLADDLTYDHLNERANPAANRDRVVVAAAAAIAARGNLRTSPPPKTAPTYKAPTPPRTASPVRPANNTWIPATGPHNSSVQGKPRTPRTPKAKLPQLPQKRTVVRGTLEKQDMLQDRKTLKSPRGKHITKPTGVRNGINISDTKDSRSRFRKNYLICTTDTDLRCEIPAYEDAFQSALDDFLDVMSHKLEGSERLLEEEVAKQDRTLVAEFLEYMIYIKGGGYKEADEAL